MRYVITICNSNGWQDHYVTGSYDHAREVLKSVGSLAFIRTEWFG